MTKHDIIQVDGKILQKTLFRNWTKQALACYQRGCNCQGCDVIPSDLETLEKCEIKKFVKGYFLLGKYPKLKE